MTEFKTTRTNLPFNHPVDSHQELCLALGGDSTSFTGDLLRLIAKADQPNRARLRQAFPGHVAAWERWLSEGGHGVTAGQLRDTAKAAERAEAQRGG